VEPLAKVVIPVKTGIQKVYHELKRLDSHFRGNDEERRGNDANAGFPIKTFGNDESNFCRNL
jgi:hypothetical protein